MRYIFATILFFILTGCVSSRMDSVVEQNDQTDMVLAESMEKSLNFQDAIKEYSAIFKRYTNTNIQKKAAIKVAQLNIHPNNSKIDYKAALVWLQMYSNLPLTPDEEENALILAALIRQINLIEEEKDKLASQIKKQNTEKTALLQKLTTNTLEKKALVKKLTIYEAEQDTLEKELSTLKENLQKFKEIDIQMHKSRKGNAASPLSLE